MSTAGSHAALLWQKELIGMIDVMVRRLKRFGYLTDRPNRKNMVLMDEYDDNLFPNIPKSQHSLHSILPPAKLMTSLKESGHPYTLFDFNTTAHKRSFTIRSLYSFETVLFQSYFSFISIVREVLRINKA